MVNFSGILQQDSPSCIKLLQTHFNLVTSEKISALYYDLFQKGPLVERIALRPEGVRFNPRPARLVHILLTELRAVPIEQIEGAFNFSFKPNSLFIDRLKLTEDLRFELYSLASFLDELRHLHMNKSLKRETVDDLIAFVESLNVKNSFDLDFRLKSLLLAAIERIKRYTKVN